MRTILLIDDDEDDSELFREAIGEVDPAIAFHHFDDGNKAIRELVEQKTFTPDIIFLDINLPRINGWECLKLFKGENHLRNVPVIIYSTSSQQKEKETADQLGAAGFITKPNDYQELKSVLQQVLSRQQL